MPYGSLVNGTSHDESKETTVMDVDASPTVEDRDGVVLESPPSTKKKKEKGKANAVSIGTVDSAVETKKGKKRKGEGADGTETAGRKSKRAKVAS